MLGLPEVAAAADRRTPSVGSGPTDRHSIGFAMRINQEGTALVGFGYFTRVRRLSAAQFFTRPPAKSSSDPRASDPSAARFTFLSEAKLEAISKVGDAITSTGHGRMRVFHQQAGGADFADPASFGRGLEIGAFDATFQDDLAPAEPDHATGSLIGDLAQNAVRRFTAGTRSVRFGRGGLPWSMQATGRGVRTEPTRPRSQLSLTGILGVVDGGRPP